ncbi:hypothetical protein Bbelb_334860 [Branchiostoma belcheri]|nr:hypothetical protein Bbelb_334860 [Branchiostoma belcheri]
MKNDMDVVLGVEPVKRLCYRGYSIAARKTALTYQRSHDKQTSPDVFPTVPTCRFWHAVEAKVQPAWPHHSGPEMFPSRQKFAARLLIPHKHAGNTQTRPSGGDGFNMPPA